jgi:hydrogenase maturation protein HypF
MALSYLHTLLGESFSLEGLPISKLNPTELEIIKQQLKQQINTPLTSSAGRLFDAVSALVGVRGAIDYEAQAAIELEMLAPDEADKLERKSYPFSTVEHQGIRVVQLGELLLAIVQDVKTHTPIPMISLKFHNTVAEIITTMCKLMAKDIRITRVALSGGVFQNRLLLKLATSALQRDGFSVLSHHLVPCNDSGISLGQAVIANFALS